MFVVGEKVVYPVHGAGIIEDIEQQEVLGETRCYYALRLYVGDMRLLVPVDAVERVGMRRVCSADKLDEVRLIFKETAAPWEDNWNRRYRLNMDKIKSGDICLLAEVVRDLLRRDSIKGLSTGEKKMLDNARKILMSEVALAAGEEPETAEKQFFASLRETQDQN
ncbi:MAG: CarD family transcriptional regulator [Clostridiales bacterium]|nr:CarD family transcriptional regulator [Clostridiales bacterium]